MEELTELRLLNKQPCIHVFGAIYIESQCRKLGDPTVMMWLIIHIKFYILKMG